MSEHIQRTERHEFDLDYHTVTVEYGGYTGVARMVDAAQEKYRWQITIYGQVSTICYWDGPEIAGDGNIVVSVDDIENAQHEINRAIEQFIWDPMSQA